MRSFRPPAASQPWHGDAFHGPGESGSPLQPREGLLLSSRGFRKGAGEGRKTKERQMREGFRNRARLFLRVYKLKGSNVRCTSKHLRDCLRF